MSKKRTYEDLVALWVLVAQNEKQFSYQYHERWLWVRVVLRAYVVVFQLLQRLVMHEYRLLRLQAAVG
jgi:hypothetical protein